MQYFHQDPINKLPSKYLIRYKEINSKINYVHGSMCVSVNVHGMSKKSTMNKNLTYIS